MGGVPLELRPRGRGRGDLDPRGSDGGAHARQDERLLRAVEHRLVGDPRPRENQTMADQDIKQIVKDKYGKAALQVVAGSAASCCSTSACCGTDAAADPITSNLYSE